MGTSTSIERAHRALQAGQRARIVQHARLRPAHEDDAAQMRFAVEDALNTADFADCGRLIVVRRLKLAAVPPRASAAWMARAMESAWRSLAMQAVPVAHPSAASAQAVYFASRVEARLAWLRCVAVGQPVDAWFWAAAMPELGASARQPEHAVAVVVDALLRDAAPALMAGLNEWPDATVLSLARVVPVDTHRAMLAAMTRAVPMDGVPTNPAARVLAAKALPDALVAVASRVARAAPLADEAVSWIAALWIAPVLARAPTLDDVRAVVTRAVWMAAGSAQGAMAAAGGEGGSVMPAPSGAEEDDATHAHIERLGSRVPSAGVDARMDASPNGHRAQEHAGSPAWQIESGLNAAPSRPSAKVARRHAPRGLPWLADAAFTSHGGLMLVLNVLRAMRFESASPAFVDGLMLHLLDAVGAPDDEPQRAWFEARGEPSPTRDGAFDRLSPNGEAVAHRSVDGDRHLDSRFRLWRTRLRRTLRRHVGLDLPDLIRRPAWASATATHIDVVYPMSGIDLRLRRLGLDADPGWVPWFGRIVTFHFIDDDLLPSREDDHG